LRRLLRRISKEIAESIVKDAEIFLKKIKEVIKKMSSLCII